MRRWWVPLNWARKRSAETHLTVICLPASVPHQTHQLPTHGVRSPLVGLCRCIAFFSIRLLFLETLVSEGKWLHCSIRRLPERSINSSIESINWQFTPYLRTIVLLLSLIFHWTTTSWYLSTPNQATHTESHRKPNFKMPVKPNFALPLLRWYQSPGDEEDVLPYSGK